MKMNRLRKLAESSFVRNTSWIISGRIVQAALGFVIGIFAARFLGPRNFGLIGYAAALSSFIMPLCTLGLKGIMVNELLENPKEQGIILGSSIILRLMSSTIAVVVLVVFVAFSSDDVDTIVVVTLYNINLLFQSFDLINYWFQSKLLSKVSVLVSLIAYIIVAVYRILLLSMGSSVYWFALAQSLDVFIIATLLLFSYRKNNGLPLAFNRSLGRKLLKKSYHFMVSGFAVAIYGQISVILLKHWLDETSVGYYSLAFSVSTMWVFVLSAVIDSARPIIIKTRKNDIDLYRKRIVQVYSFIIYSSTIVAAVFTIFARIIIVLLFGVEYLPATPILRIVVWSTAFSYLGVSRSIWLVSEGKIRYEKLIAVIGAMVSVVLNITLIPLLGLIGAAIAVVCTQLLTNVLIPFFVPELRENSIFILKAFNPRYLIGFSSLKKKEME